MPWDSESVVLKLIYYQYYYLFLYVLVKYMCYLDIDLGTCIQAELY